jgi:hypothetical protein
VNLDTLLSPEDFGNWLDTLFQDGYCFEQPSYGTINNILYEFEKVSNMRKQLKSINKKPELRIAGRKNKIDRKRLSLYHEPKISNDDTAAEYFFEKVYTTNDDYEEVETTLNIDEFYAQMWVKGIRFGLDLAKISNIIQESTQ